jgi:transposase-like protein
MADIDEDYDGDLGPLLADLAALRSALGDSYQAYEEINPDNGWQQQQQQAATQAAGATDGNDASKKAPRGKPAPLIERLAAVSAALEANQSLQQRLHRLITSVNRAQDQAVGIRDRVRTAQRRKQVAASAPHALSARKSDQDKQFTGVSWYWSQPGASAPPLYPGFSEIKPIVEMLPLVFPHRRWQEEERNALCDGVVQVVQERMLNKLLTDLESTPMTTAGAGGGGGGVFQAGISLEEFEARQAPIRTLTASSPEVIEIAASLTDAEWATVAHRSVHGRTARECCLQWHNAAKPTLNLEKFTESEDNVLISLVEQYGQRSWDRIARELHTQEQSAGIVLQAPARPLTASTLPLSTTTVPHSTPTATPTTLTKYRTPLACMARYQQLQHATRDTQAFTTADRERLIQIVNRVGVQWKRVAEEFGGPWDFDQLMHQWRRHAQRHEGGVDGAIATAVIPRRGKWRSEEDEALLTAVALYGKKWSHVAKLVLGRSDVQCRERYANCLDPEVNKEPWNEQEDEILRENIRNFTNQVTGKIKWSSIAELIPGRTDYAVKKRWIALTNAQSRGGAGTGRAQGGRRRGGGGGANGSGVNDGGAGFVSGGDTCADDGAGPSTADVPLIVSNGEASGGAKRKEPVQRKKQQAAALPAAVAAPIEPPPPPEGPVVTRRGRTITLPSRLAE